MSAGCGIGYPQTVRAMIRGYAQWLCATCQSYDLWLMTDISIPEVFGPRTDASSRSYRPVEDHVAPAGSVYNPGVKNTMSREELVSVPVLGPE